MANLARKIADYALAGKHVAAREPDFSRVGYKDAGGQFIGAMSLIRDDFRELTARLQDEIAMYRADDGHDTRIEAGQKLLKYESAALEEFRSPDQRKQAALFQIKRDWELLNDEDTVRRFNRLADKAVDDLRVRLDNQKDPVKKDRQQDDLDASLDDISRAKTSLVSGLRVFREAVRNDVEEVLRDRGTGGPER